MSIVVKINGKLASEMTPEQLAAHDARSKARFDEMVGSGKAPRVKSDDTFFRGYTKTGGDQFVHPEMRKFYLDEAKKAGVSVSGKQYFSEIAAFPGDPRAWIGSRGEMTKLLEERNWSSEGDINVKCEPVEPDAPKKMAEDMIEDMVFERLADEFENNGKEVFSRDEVDGMKAEVVETHGSPY